MAVTIKQLEEELENKRLEFSTVQAELSRLEIELSELEIAARIHRRIELAKLNNGLYDSNSSFPNDNDADSEIDIQGGHDGHTKRSLAGKTMSECAEIILAERKIAHAKEIADEAIQRGYQSPRGGDADAIRQSFWAIINRNKERFHAEGNGRYTLIPREETTDEG